MPLFRKIASRIREISPLTIAFVLVVLLFAVTHEKQSRRPVFRENEDREDLSASVLTPRDRIGCKAMVQDFCGKLYAPEARGNLRIVGTDQEFSTLQGQTKNDFDQAWYAFYKARLDRADKLPLDLQRALKKRWFFEQLRVLLSRPPRAKMELETSIEFGDIESQVDSSWELAIEETLARRMNRKFPGIYKLKDSEAPQHVDVQTARMKAKLWSEISLALWKGHPNWKKVESDFKNLQEAFLAAIAKFNVDGVTKANWANKIASVKLELPGENPMTAGPSCISVLRNAYYYKYLNTMTVCAGYFTGGTQILTLAHELSHAIDFSTRLTDVQQSTKLADSLRSLRTRVCTKEQTFDCAGWNEFKSGFPAGVSDILSIEPEASQIHACLQKTKPTKAISSKVISDQADSITRSRFSELTRNSTFFRLTNKEIKSPNGTKLANPSYMNPCANEVWDSAKFAVDSEFTSLIMFSAAYRCADPGSASQLRAAIDESKEMTRMLVEASLASEKTFSPREAFQSQGYSSPPTERFADRVGSYVVAEYLKNFPQVESRRSTYLASNFWLCDKPSLRSENLDQFHALSDLLIERGVHAENEARIQDWLSPPVQNVLSCDSDFEQGQCLLTSD